MRMLLATPVLCLVACAHTASVATVDAVALVSAPDRTPEDRAMDGSRRPAAFLDFIALRPGMRVGELLSSAGYTTELLARAVGPTGVVYGQNTPHILKVFVEKPWAQRLARPALANVVRSDRELEAPFPPDAVGLDRVVSNANYHDTVWLKVDRPAMNAAVLAALKSGGRYVVCDSSAKDGAGLTAVETLHRIEEKVVRSEVEAAGFTFVASGDFLRNPGDTREWTAAPGEDPRSGTGDRFCLSFAKP